jgi:LAS superfamily LD-carboxypeptidase LdcB
MKTLLTSLLIIFLNGILFAQTNQPSDSKQTKQEPLFKQSQTSELQDQILLPNNKKKFRPKLTLQRALQLAENYIEKEKIDISSFYLYQAKFIMFGGKEQNQPAWHFWWLNEKAGVGNYVQLVVLIDTGTVRWVHSL